MNGASTANGAIVISSASATRPRAWSTEALKNNVPASATATNASPTLLAAVSSIRLVQPGPAGPARPGEPAHRPFRAGAGPGAAPAHGPCGTRRLNASPAVPRAFARPVHASSILPRAAGNDSAAAVASSATGRDPGGRPGRHGLRRAGSLHSGVIRTRGRRG